LRQHRPEIKVSIGDVYSQNSTRLLDLLQINLERLLGKKMKWNRVTIEGIDGEQIKLLRFALFQFSLRSR
jgi:hypothetical protein